VSTAPGRDWQARRRRGRRRRGRRPGRRSRYRRRSPLPVALALAPAAAAARITGLLHAADFYERRYGPLFDLVADHVRAGTPHGPASTAATITAAGVGPDHHDTRLHGR